ncbi:MAG: hypothetical protein JO165_04585 [Candidatus Eremiobacteraeota bacterium]|nr:hypothetical protein [Candidatus Eremiobacteraeota bacterium]
MDISSIDGGAVSQQIDVSVLSAVQNLEQNVAARLFSSLGVGTVVDTYA